MVFMLRKEIHFFMVVCLLFSTFFFLPAQNKTIVLGGKSGWQPMQSQENITVSEGRFGQQAVMIDTDNKKVDAYTDLLLSFEQSEFLDEADNYIVESNSLILTDKAIRGKKSAISRGIKEGIVIRGKNNSVFGKAGYTGSFTIDFWLCPSVVESGETVFSWRSSKNEEDTISYQMILGGFINNKFEWRFTNVFLDDVHTESEIVLTSFSSIIPSEWKHHLISYNEDDGLLEYSINGSVEAVYHVSSPTNKRGSVLLPILGAPSALVICSDYIGGIDDFRISKKVIETDRNYDTYNSIGGHFITEPLLTSGLNSKMNLVESVMSVPGETGYQFFVRAGNNCYDWTDSYPAWKPINLNTPILDIYGLYFQLAVDLYPDGYGEKTPSITEITISYSEVAPPLPPYSVYTEAGNGFVDITWNDNSDSSTGGYLIYYGERPGEYIGSIALEGKSPIDVGKKKTIRINGLKNGKIYYFAVSSYSNIDKRIEGVLSKEVYARPLRGINEKN